MPLAGLACVCLLSACSTYSNFSVQLREDLRAGNVEAALDRLEDQGGKDPDVLNLMEVGLLYHYGGYYDDSNDAFQLAESKIDDQYTKSISGEALAFLTNDGNLPYSGYPHEQVLIHIYGALNYGFQENWQDALVECRRAGLRLDQLGKLRDAQEGYTDDAFAQWLTGIFFAESGDANAAMVSARRAELAYEEYQRLFNMPIPREFYIDYLTWAKQFGFDNEAREILVDFAELDEVAVPLGPDEGEIVLIYESGFVNHLEEIALSFPIFESDRNRNDADMAVIMTQRGPRGVYTGNTSVAYWLRVALPKMVPTKHAIRTARLRVGDRVATTSLVEDISAIAQLTFDEGEGARLLKTIARGFAKWKLTEAAGNQSDVAGILANITAVATERADTRSWSTLPDRIHMARMRLPVGTHSVTLECLDSQGNVAETAVFEQVQVLPRSGTVVRHRTYR